MPTATETPLASDRGRILPNPLPPGGQGRFAYRLDLPVDEVALVVFGLDYRRAARVTGLPTAPGVNHVVVLDLARLAPGAYVAVVETRSGGRRRAWPSFRFAIRSRR